VRRRFGSAIDDPAVHPLEDQRCEDRARDLRDDVAGQPQPREVPPYRKCERDRGIEVGSGNRAMKKMIAMTMMPGANAFMANVNPLP
jgi:hypothetical protein